jgi:ATP-dependent dihydroxyacetone kinase
MKKLINSPLSVVREMLEGFVALAPDQALLADENVVVQAGLGKSDQRRVAIISGGGSGHEPAHAGYVGRGMLTAAVAGDVFTSPSSDAVLAAIRECAGPAGALLIVKNYTGDRLNFGLAAELARLEGIPIEVVVVADDVALRNTVADERRRGIAGTVLIHKIAGAAADSGTGLGEVAALSRAAASDLGTMGVALGSCTLPNVGHPSFVLESDEIELGLGIHGEPGVRRDKMAGSAALVERVLTSIIEDRQISSNDRVVLLVNGLGATPPMELGIVLRDALRFLIQHKIRVERAWCGTFLSSLDMPGFSLSVLRVDEERLAWLDAPAHTPAWPGGGRLNSNPPTPQRRTTANVETPVSVALTASSPIHLAVLAAAQSMIDQEAALTELDAKAGDGDLGSSMARGAAAARLLPDSAWTSPTTALTSLGDAMRRAIAGSSGPLYASAILRAARSLSGVERPTDSQWGLAFSNAVDTISELGGARVGDRTMVDALRPAASAFQSALEDRLSVSEAWIRAVEAARAGRDATANMYPRLGRASYLGERAIGVTDAGAAAVVCWMEALTPHIQ